MSIPVILTSYSYSDGKVVAGSTNGELSARATPIGNSQPHPHHSVGFIETVHCVDCDGLTAYIYVPVSDYENWEAADFHGELCSISDDLIIYDSIGNSHGDAVPGYMYMYSPTLKTLFSIEEE